MANIITTLSQRGFISQSSDPALAGELESPATLYAGFDPTASSLHIGHLLQIMALSQFQRHGHRPIALVGGATAMIGDPSGKSEERNFLDEQTIYSNLEGIEVQLQRFLDFDEPGHAALLVNNGDWIGRFGFIEFLRDVGKHFRLGDMLGKESVRKRMQSKAGLSFTEFSYQLLQSYDFLHLFRQYDCRLQIGGDDQWGNITAGIDLIRRLEGQAVFGLTSPLMTKADGQKFGKTEGGTVWLDPQRTSPYEFYQYLIRTDDRDVGAMLKLYTFLSLEEIAALEEQVKKEPEKHCAQTVLADQATSLVHGRQELEKVQQASQVLFGREISGLSDADLNGIFGEVPSTELARKKLSARIDLTEALCQTRLSNSHSEAKKLIKAGGAYVNNVRIGAIDHQLSPDSLASETMIVLRSGKKKYHLLRFT